jgi:Transposase DDE domain
LWAQEKELAGEVEGLLAEAERVDQAEDQRYGRGCRGDDLAPEFAEREGRLRKIREAKAELEWQARQQAEEKKAKIERRLRERPQRAARTGRGMPGKLPVMPDPGTAVPKPRAVVNLTDSDSRVMRESSSSGFVQGFNAQAAVDGHRQIIVAAEGTNQPADRAQLVPRLREVERNTGAKPEKLSADTGYSSPDQVWSPQMRGIDLYGKPDRGPKKYRQPAAASPPGPLGLRRKKWRLRCGYDANGVARIEPLRAKLASAEGQAIYQKRRAIVEPVFGQIKQGRGLRQFLLRGLDQARAEWKLICLTHNLLKLHRAGWSLQGA